MQTYIQAVMPGIPSRWNYPVHGARALETQRELQMIELLMRTATDRRRAARQAVAAALASGGAPRESCVPAVLRRCGAQTGR